MKRILKYISIPLTLLFLFLFLTACQSNKAIIDQAYAKLFDGFDSYHVLEDFTLSNQIDDVTILYVSNDEEIIKIETDDLNTTFKVTRPQENVIMSIDVLLTYKKEEITYKKDLHVLKIGSIFDFTPYPGQASMQLLHDAMKKNKYRAGLPLNDASNLETRVQNILIIPIEFNDYTFSENDLTNLEIAFFGTEEETGYQSVKTYYYNSSYGKVDFQGDILEPYQTNQNANYYYQKYRSDDVDQEIMKEAIIHYDSEIDYQIYDTDSDGYIDAVYLIYAHTQESSSSSNNLWWAWEWEYNQIDRNNKYDGVKLGSYVWASKNFINEPISYYKKPYKYVNVNASIYIHETGHLFGLEDYYDTNKNIGPSGGLGGLDMMDNNIGDHSSYSKIVLGWVVPEVIYQSITIRIKPFESSGEVILIPKKWNDSYFDEYLLVDFYTPTGLNAIGSGRGLYDISGVRIYHVSSEIGKNTNGYSSVLKYDNSDENIKLIKLIEANNLNIIESMRTSYLSTVEANGILFLKQSNFDFASYTWNDNKELGFTITILDITKDYADIKITYS
ncbi:M6 family metalloprotease domain-containing protein [Acholeplasma sp. OttesenSCG-928-E16]|nr:M6 family metalloprotease domain-containing protein [Acholeplasma sp. OttesenSCG-928-E16]